MNEVIGTIESFDEHRGDGVLRGDNGEGFYFHCVSIADGSRRITTGSRAISRRAVGRSGRDEVVDVRSLPGP